VCLHEEWSFGADSDLEGDECREAQESADGRADALVGGAGQADLSLGARLGQLGVETLLVAKTTRSVTTGETGTTRSPCTTR
jgi:hypothetical protein